MKKYQILLLLFLCFQNLIGQVNSNTLLPNILPSSPQVSQFLQYGEVPIQHYTGIPKINIPIYNLKAKGLEIPIYLSYKSNGIKVNQESGWVGLGWSISSDMEIVQSVLGFDDFGYYSYTNYPNFDCLIPIQSSGLTASSVMSQENTFFLGFDDYWNIQNPECIFHPVYFAGIKDSEPDIFYFNFLYYQGKFMLDWSNDTFVCLTDKRIKINAPNYRPPNQVKEPGEFIITVPDGHRFIFNLKDETIVERSYSINPNGGAIPTPGIDLKNHNEKTSRVYKLTQIITNKGDFIDFEYTTSSMSMNLPSVSYTYRTYKPQVGAGTNYFPKDVGFIKSFLVTKQTFSYLSKIVHNNTKIEFINSERVDIKEAKKLDKITIKNENKLIDEYAFNYSYFTGNSLGNNWDSYLDEQFCGVSKTSNELTDRLKLNSFRRQSQNPYIFNYNPISLPKKTSYSTDYWGYYNGQHENTSFMPNIYRFNIQRDEPLYLKFEDNNKSADLNYVKAALLEKVVYPSGGATEYEYELNTFDNYNAPDINQGKQKQINLGRTVGSFKRTKIIINNHGSTIFQGHILLSTRGAISQKCTIRPILKYMFLNLLSLTK